MKMFLEIFLLVIAIIIIGYLFFYSTDILLAPSSIQSLGNKVCFGPHCFSVELAVTSLEKLKGLSLRKQLDKNSGMLFVFDKESNYSFWMKDTLIPLDIVWIDGSGKIVFINDNIQPCKQFICPQINPKVNAKYVLEINAGSCKEIGAKIGDKVNISITP